jgi:hypothetical protein
MLNLDGDVNVGAKKDVLRAIENIAISINMNGARKKTLRGFK